MLNKFVCLFHISKLYLTQKILMLHYHLVMPKGNKNQPLGWHGWKKPPFVAQRRRWRAGSEASARCKDPKL